MKKKHISQKALTALIALTTSAYLTACSAQYENSDNNVDTANTESTVNGSESSDNNEQAANKGNSYELGEQLLPTTITAEKGFVVAGDDNSSETRNVYFDFACPECHYYEQTLSAEMEEKLPSGDIKLVLNPIPFLDSNTVDNYSSRAASAFITVAEYAPDKAYDYFHYLFSTDFYPSMGAGHQARTTTDLVNAALEVGVDKDIAEKIYDNHYYEWVQKAVDFAEEDGLIFPQGMAETPTVVHNGTYDNEGKLVDDGNFIIEK